MLVSVITIFLNAERFLHEAVESILAQTFPDWELLLVDDGSTDGSTDLARHYAETFPERVRYLEHEGHRNRGMSASRNLGIAHAQGEHLAFLDADDVWLPQKLERQAALLRRHPEAAMVYGPSLMWYGWTGDPADAAHDDVRQLGVRPGRVVEGTTLLARMLDGRGVSPTTCGVLLRREAVTRVGGFEPSFRGMFEDQVFFAKVLLDGHVYVMEECLDLYRQHADSCCARAEHAGTYDPEALAPSPSREPFLTWLADHLAAPPSASALRRRVDRELWLHRHPSAFSLRARIREGAQAARARLTGVAFALGQRILPRPVRQWLWDRTFRASRSPSVPLVPERLLNADAP